VILIQAGLTLLIVLLAGALLFDRLADWHDRKAHRLETELTELQVQQHIYPDGNVHILTPDKESED
jgi:hypothetical protein